jgi:soluble cytochrome b562
LKKEGKLTESVESQVKGLWKHTILPALGEDLTFGDKKNAVKAIKTLKQLVSKLNVNDFYIGEGKLTEGKYFQKWQENLKNLEKLYVDVHHAKKAIPHKKKELLKIEKHYKELHKLVPIIVGQMVDEGKLKEAKETIFDVAEKVLQDKQMHVYKSSKGKVKVDLQTANLLVKVFKKVNPKMLKILINLGFKDPAQLVQTLWAVVK